MMYLAQIDLLRDLSKLEPGQLFLIIIVLAFIVLIFLSRSSGGAIAQSAMKTLDKLVDRFERVTEELTDQRGELKEQQAQSKLLTDALRDVATSLKDIRQENERLANAMQMSGLAVDENNKIMVDLAQTTEAVGIKVDNLSRDIEGDTAATQKLIAESAEQTIKVTGERLTELDTVIKALPESFCHEIKAALSNDLTAIKVTVNSIMARLDAQKDESNEAPFTPIVDLHVPIDGKSGHGTGGTTDNA